MIIYIDQTPLKYVPTDNFTLAGKGAKSVIMEGGSDKRCITGTFGRLGTPPRRGVEKPEGPSALQPTTENQEHLESLSIINFYQCN